MFKLDSLNQYREIQIIDKAVYNLYKVKGFEILKQRKDNLKVGLKVQKSELFEGRIGRLFIQCLNFKDVKVRKKVGRHVVDCVAVNDDLIVIVEAKTRESINPKDISIKGYVDTFSGKKLNISKALRAEGYNQRIEFIIVLEDISPSSASLDHAKEEFINVLTSKNLDLLEQLYKTVGPERTAQHFYHHFDVPMVIETEDQYAEMRFPVIKSQYNAINNGVYSAYISAKDLLDITYVHRISEGDVDDYQRVLTEKRLKSIADFIEDGNSFNSSVVIALEVPVRFKLFRDEEKRGLAFGLLHVPKRKSIARIIDGQHRIFSYVWASAEHLLDKVPVIILAGINRSEQARLFVDINANQKSVDKSTLLTIMSNTEPYGIGLVPNIVKSLNKTGVFHQSVKIKGINDKTRNESKLTMAGMTKDIQKRMLFDDITKPRILISKPDTVNREVVDEAVKMIDDYFRFILNDVTASRQSIIERYVYTNVGFSILSYVFKEFLIYQKYIINRDSYAKVLQEPLKEFFEANSEDYLIELLSRSGEASFKASALVVIKVINQRFIAFGAEFIQNSTPLSTAANTEDLLARIQQAVNNLERRLKDLIKRSFYSDEDKLFDVLGSDVSSRLRSRIDKKRKGYMPVETDGFDELSWDNIDSVIGLSWTDIFVKHFGNDYDKNRVLGDLDTIKRFRNEFLGHQKLIKSSEVPLHRVTEMESALSRMEAKVEAGQ